MVKRNELKKQGRILVRQNYLRAISVCFLIAMLTTAYPVTTTFFGFHSVSGLPDGKAVTPDLSNSDVAVQVIERFFPGGNISDKLPPFVLEAGGLIVDICTSASSIFFSVLRAVNGFLTENPETSVLFLAAGAVLAVLGQIFISNILEIGEKRFFMESRKYRQTQISKIFFCISFVVSSIRPGLCSAALCARRFGILPSREASLNTMSTA